jgi:cardiolipin synthase
MQLAISPLDWLTLHGLVTVVAVLVYVVTTHLMRQRRAPAAAIAWILFILLLPYLALPAYLTFGSRKRKRPAAGRRALMPPDRDLQGWVADTLAALSQPAPAAYDSLHVHADGAAAQAALMAVIDQARHRIDICTFILRDDSLGTLVIDQLCDKARAGVKVRLLLDGMGSLMAGRPRLQRLTDAGGQLVLFVPPLHSPLRGRTNLRNHRKMLIVDGGFPQARLWCGGRNLAAEYFQGERGAGAWRDLSFDLQGPLVQQAVNLFEHDWAFANDQSPPANKTQNTATVPARSGGQLVASGPDQADDSFHDLLVTATYRAERRLWLVTPYFVPESALLSALCLSARRGVAVELLLPARSNHRLSDLARERALRALVQSGGRVWLVPGMLHAKLVVVDDALALAGSANLDSRSLFLNYELMMAFQPQTDVQTFAHWFEAERERAKPYRAHPPGLLRDVLEGMLLWVGFQL